MEYELRALRNQLAEKSKHFLQLKKKVRWDPLNTFCNSLLRKIWPHTLPIYIIQLAMCRKSEENISLLYEIDGNEALGSCLRVRPCSDEAPDLSKCTIQWYRSSSDDSKKELISGPTHISPYLFLLSFSNWNIYLMHILCIINSGATKSVYAPEPFDVGRALHADIIYNGHTLSLSTVGKIDPGSFIVYFVFFL